MPHLFAPQYFDSQPCEGFYRMIRSFTSTYSTVANCTVKQILGRIHKIQLQGDISNKAISLGLLSKKKENLQIECAVRQYKQKKNQKSSDVFETEEEDWETQEDILEVLSGLQLTTLPNFAHKFAGKEVAEDSPYVEISNGDRSLVVKKTSICWLMGKVTPRLSSDRLERVKSGEKKITTRKTQTKSKKSKHCFNAKLKY